MRKSELRRATAETDIALALELDGTGVSQIATGCGFLDHMLTLFARHGNFDLEVSCKGDVNVDFHHTVEDVGICLGMALNEALGDKAGISRYGSMMLPMDESLILCAIDISGRGYLSCKLDIPSLKIGDFDCELVEEFFLALTRNCPITLHLKKLDGRNSHHIVEGAFKAFGRALCQAVSIDPRQEGRVPSTKGVL